MKTNTLNAPSEYFELSKEEKENITNKCGPSGALSEFIPNSLMGVDISESCNIHDYMYHNSKSSNDLKKADLIFYKNMNKQIGHRDTFLTTLRQLLVMLYYILVRLNSVFVVNF